MKRRQFLAASGLTLAASAVAAPAVAQAMPETRWRCTSSFSKSLDTIHGAAEVFAKAVSEATDGKFQIQVFAAGEIVPGLQALDAVANGTVELAHTSSDYYVGKDPTFAIPTALPFGLNSRMQNAWQYFGGGIELMNDFYKRFGIYALPCGNTGARMGGWFRREVREQRDLNGLKMRIGGFAGGVVKKLGVVPQQIAGADIFSALEKGTLDAAEWVGPHDDEKLGLHKVAPHYHYPGWWAGGAMIHLFFNRERWEELSPAYKSIVRTSSETANAWMQARYDAVNPAALKRLLGGGARLAPFPGAVMDACLSAALEICRETSAANADFKKAWEAQLAFRNDQYLWWQVAEYSYDTFLIRNRTRT